MNGVFSAPKRVKTPLFVQRGVRFLQTSLLLFALGYSFDTEQAYSPDVSMVAYMKHLAIFCWKFG